MYCDLRRSCGTGRGGRGRLPCGSCGAGRSAPCRAPRARPSRRRTCPGPGSRSSAATHKHSSTVNTGHNVSTVRERNVLFNDTLNTFYLRLYGVRYMVKDLLIVRKETRCCHISYSFRVTARVLLYAPSHRQDNTYHGLCYTSRGALAGTNNISIKPIKDALKAEVSL